MCSTLALVELFTGTPVFNKAYGDGQPLSFPLVGTLHGAHMFAASQGPGQLVTTVTDKTKVAWKVYEDSLKMIIVTCKVHITDQQLQLWMDSLFHALVLVVGMDALLVTGNIDELKKTLQGCQVLVEQLMCDESGLFGHVTNCVDVVIPSNATIVQDCLLAFVEMAQTNYGCLLVGGKVCVATESWWKLKPTELNLLCHLVKACVKRGTTSADIPAYLPYASSRIPHRLVVFHLMQSCQVLLLLGPEPSLSSLLPQVPRYWNVVRDRLEELQTLASRNIAPCHGVSVEPQCKACLVVNRALGRCVFMHFGNTSSLVLEKREEEKQHNARGGHSVQTLQLQLLKFVESVTGKYVAVTAASDTLVLSLLAIMEQVHLSNSCIVVLNVLFSSARERGAHGSVPVLPNFSDNPGHKPFETYMCLEDYNCYAVQEESYLLYALFAPDTSSPVLRTLSRKLLQQVKTVL